MIRLIKPYITFEEVEDSFKDIFDSGWFSKGKNCTTFAEVISEYTGAKYSFLTTSATTALWVCLKALDIGPGDEVIFSDFSFPATVNVVEDLCALPVFCDVNLDTYNMSAEDLKTKISDRTKAVIFVDALGNPSGIHDIKEICVDNGIPLIEDAACAIGSSENGIKCGNIADFTCFSFHPRKLLTTGEGGAITVNSDRYADFFNAKLNHGAVLNDGRLDFVTYGYNFRLSEFQSAMGIIQLKKLDEIVESRNKIRNEYIERLKDTELKVQELDHGVTYNVQSLVFSIDPKKRDGLIEYLRENEIETIFGTYSLSATSYYAKKYDSILRNSSYLFSSTITLPCYQGIPVKKVCREIICYLES